MNRSPARLAGTPPSGRPIAGLALAGRPWGAACAFAAHLVDG